MPPQPVPDPLAALSDRCVQCGLCLPACPTYARERLETESPRGRIALLRAWALEAAAPTPAGEAHLDHCLGCRRCEAVCPAGVHYGELLVEGRRRQRKRRGAAWRQRALEALAARPRLLDALLRLYRSLHPLLPGPLRPLPRPPGAAPAPSPSTAAAAIAVFRGCVGGVFEAPVRDAFVRLSAAAGLEVVEPRGQTCCGALHAHAGAAERAARLAAANRAALAAFPVVATIASGCHAHVAAARGPAATRDALELLAEHAERLRFRPARVRIALHLPCTQRSVVRSDAALRRLLAQVPALEVVELDAGYGCCGAAGSHMLLDPQRAAAFRAPLVAAIRQSGASCVLSANIGCRLHLAPACPVPVRHPLEALADWLAS